MHPKEFKKTKNGTGYLTHLSLKNSTIYRGINFSNHDEINKLILNPNNNCFILYPDENSIDISKENIHEHNKTNVIFIIDATWPCSRSIIKNSPNIASLPKISFQYQKPSQFKIKTQPNAYCLSTIESTRCMLQELTKQNIESLNTTQLTNFLKPFEQMVAYQVDRAKETNDGHERKKLAYKKAFH
jgi:DTW domain-containing protein YfiP